MAKKPEKEIRQKGSKPAPRKKGTGKARTTRKKVEPDNSPAATSEITPNAIPAVGRRIIIPGFQNKAGLALATASLILVTLAGAWFDPDPVSGTLYWLFRGASQVFYIAFLALFLWLQWGRKRGITYLLLLGLGCSAIAIWDIASGMYVHRLRQEANAILADFRDEPSNAVGMPGIIENNSYVEAYMIMRDVYWDLHSRLDDRMADYGAAYGAYVENGHFLNVKRLKSRYELWRGYYQIEDLERYLAQIESDPLNLDDLLWTVNLLDIDPQTREAYASDLKEAIATASKLQLELLDRERRTLAQIKHSLKVLIDAKGRYRFARGRIVFENPADAALFAGNGPPSNQ